MRPSSLVCTIFRLEVNADLPNVLATGKIVQRLNNLITTKLESLLHLKEEFEQSSYCSLPEQLGKSACGRD
jgi:hypothetical protein